MKDARNLILFGYKSSGKTHFGQLLFQELVEYSTTSFLAWKNPNLLNKGQAAMLRLDLMQGDKVHLPSFTEINGKTYKLISYDSHKSKQFMGIYCIYNDMLNIQNSIKSHIQNPSHDLERFHALTILYRKCWNNSGARYFKLEIQRDLKNAPKDLLEFHSFLFSMGNTYIAHPNKTDYDQSSLLLIMHDQKAIGVRPCRMTLENLNLDEYRIWLQLIDYLQANLTPMLEKMKNLVIDEYNASLQNRKQANQKF